MATNQEPVSLKGNFYLNPLNSNTNYLAYNNNFISIKAAEPSLGIPNQLTETTPNSAYYFPVITNASSYKDSRKFTNSEYGMVYYNNNLGLGTLYPSFTLTVNGSISGSNNIILGSNSCILSGYNSSIVGGINNSISAENSFVGHGTSNVILSAYSFIGGGFRNCVLSYNSSILGGSTNTICGQSSNINGGGNNTIHGSSSNINGGTQNIACGSFNTIGGGFQNRTENIYTVVNGGFQNINCASYSYIGSGCCNIITSGLNSSKGSTISGGGCNIVSGSYNSIGSGSHNTISGYYTNFLGGGRYNEIKANPSDSNSSFIGGGGYNCTFSGYNTVVGGANNCTLNSYDTIAGGYANKTYGPAAFVGGGIQNFAFGNGSVVIGGNTNVAAGKYSAIIAGAFNQLTGNNSFILGSNFVVNGVDDTTFVNNISVVGNILSPANILGDAHMFGNSQVDGDLTVLGTINNIGGFTNTDTVFVNTTALRLVNNGIGPALFVQQAVSSYPIAQFFSNQGTGVFHIGNTPTNPGDGTTGYVGINTITPIVELTVNGSISSNSNVYANQLNASNTLTNLVSTPNGNSDLWNNLYSIFSSVSSNISSTTGLKVSIDSVSGILESVFNNVNTLSSNWDTAYDSITENSDEWDSVYNNVNSLSSGWQSVYSDTNSLSGNWNSVYSLVSTTSSDWNSVYSQVYQLSTAWGVASNGFASVSSTFVYSTTSYDDPSFINTLSSNKLIGADVNNWNSVYTQVSTLSTSWGSVSASITLTPFFSSLTAAYNTVNSLSSDWGGYQSNSANLVYTVSTYNDPDWLATLSDTKVFGISRTGWDQAYTNLIQYSASYISNKTVSAIGDNTNNVFDILHNFNSQDVITQVRDISTNSVVFPSIINTSINTVTVSFNDIPTVGQYKVVIMG